MQHRYCFEAVDRTLKDICNCDADFGSIPVVLGGDFAQIPPVVRGGDRPAIVDASLISSRLWAKLQKLMLTENMRLATSNQIDREFADWIERMSYDSALIGTITLPTALRQFSDPDQFIEDVYPSHVLQRPLENPGFFQERAILCSKNVNVDTINKQVMQKVTGEMVTLLSADTVQSDLTNADMANLPAEYLRTLSTSGIPPAILELKVGMPYILKVKILGGSDAIELIPRFKLTTLPNALPFILTRKQFPVKVCFAMTINKSQGQSLRKVAVDLRNPAFTHGHLYVALSRATSANGVSILLPPNTSQTDNVV